jgi:hypothetical protein
VPTGNRWRRCKVTFDVAGGQECNSRGFMLVTWGCNGLDDPHSVGRFTVFTINHEHAFTLHLLVKCPALSILSIIFGLHSESEASFNGMRIIFE